MLVPLAVEEVRLRPLRAALGESAALRREVGVAAEFGHRRDRLERREVEELHLRIRTVVVDVHRVVLTPFHHAVAVSVPSAFAPAELDGLPYARIERAHPFVVA